MAIRRVGVYNGVEDASVIDVPKGSELLNNRRFKGWLARIAASAEVLPAEKGQSFIEKGVCPTSLASREQYEVKPPLSEEQFVELGALCASGLFESRLDDVAVADYRSAPYRQVIWGLHHTAA